MTLTWSTRRISGVAAVAGVVGHHSFWVEILLVTAFWMAFTSASIQDW